MITFLNWISRNFRADVDWIKWAEKLFDIEFSRFLIVNVIECASDITPWICEQSGILILISCICVIPVSANYLTKIGPIGLRAHECRCWANRLTIIAAHDVMPDTDDYRAEFTTSWNVLVVCQPSSTMCWCKYF